MVEGVGAAVNTQVKGSVTLTLRSTTSKFEMQIEALVLPSITSQTPAVKIDVNQWHYLRGLDLADNRFGTPGIIDILIGADVWGRVLEGEVIGGRTDEPFAQRTRFGWVVFGPAAVSFTSNVSSLALSALPGEDDVRLEELLQRFWQMEEFAAANNQHEDECAQIFEATHCRTSDGRYIVHLPLRRDAPELGDSYALAARQFYRLERRMVSDPGLRDSYVAFMREYAALGHMELVEPPYHNTNCYYIPHHAVTTKFRVVFNASAPTSTGVSLNDIQLVGPTLQDSLSSILLRFRRYRVAITADIEKMFRQVLVTPEHRDYQRIIWRESPADDIRVYRLKTITYGMACSPYNAVRTLQQCAYDNYGEVPDKRQAALARDAIQSSFYVDDFLTSCESVTEAVELARNVDIILSAGKFTLRKWNSNDGQVVSYLSNESSLSSYTFHSGVASVLGLRWDAVTDQLFFKSTSASHPMSPRSGECLARWRVSLIPLGCYHLSL